MASAPFAPTTHGGRLAEARAAFPHAPTPWLDLSTGISPWSWSGPRASRADLQRLPDPADLERLEKTAAATFGVADASRVIATAGAENGIAVLTATLGLSVIDIVSPTYGGHARSWAAAGASAREIAATDTASRVAGLVVVNPNNPDGRNLSRSQMLALAEQRRGWTIVDEAFGETEPRLSVANADAERLIVLRSFGKFYGLPGVRLGFVVAPRDLARQLRARLGEWPVSADAIALGVGAYADLDWQARQRRRLDLASRRLRKLLTAHGYDILGGTSLFTLTASADAPRRFQRLCELGVLTRPFRHDARWLRFGLPGAADWPRLEAALAEAARC